MSLPTREDMIARIAPALGDRDDLNENLVATVLDRLSVEDHLLLLEQMLAKARNAPVSCDHVRTAHRYVTSALDQVELHVLHVV